MGWGCGGRGATTSWVRACTHARRAAVHDMRRTPRRCTHAQLASAIAARALACISQSTPLLARPRHRLRASSNTWDRGGCMFVDEYNRGGRGVIVPPLPQPAVLLHAPPLPSSTPPPPLSLTVAMNLSASSTLSTSSLTGTPSSRSGLSARPSARAIASGGVVSRHRLADCGGRAWVVGLGGAGGVGWDQHCEHARNWVRLPRTHPPTRTHARTHARTDPSTPPHAPPAPPFACSAVKVRPASATARLTLRLVIVMGPSLSNT